MLGKLTKHDLRATGRFMLPYLGAMLLLGILTRFAFPLLDTVSGGLPGLLLGLIVGLFFASLGTSGLVVFIQSIDRFRRSLLGQEGYLMLTLPATRSQHILAKLLTSLIWYAAAALGSLLSAGFAFLDNRYLLSFYVRLPALSELFEAAKGHGGDIAVLLGGAAELFVIGVLALAVLTVMVYAAEALGSAFRKHKTLLIWISAFAFCYLVILAVIFVIGRGINFAPEDITGVVLLVYGGVGIVCELIVGTAFFFLTRYLLTKRLNLE